MEDKTDILIIEDSPIQATVLKRTLQKEGFEVRAAFNGKEGLSAIEEKIPDLIITDIVMPEMDGYEFTERIKSDEKMNSIPVILLTSLTNPEDIFRGLEVGADNYITKPYDEDQLIARVKFILANRLMRKRTYSEMGLKITVGGKTYQISSDRIQIIDMLISTVEDAVKKTKELEIANEKLERSMEKIKTLSGLVPICASCKKIRDDEGYWHQVEEYVSEHSHAEFSHGICPDCIKKLYPDYYEKIKNEDRNME